MEDNIQQNKQSWTFKRTVYKTLHETRDKHTKRKLHIAEKRTDEIV